MQLSMKLDIILGAIMMAKTRPHMSDVTKKQRTLALWVSNTLLIFPTNYRVDVKV